MIEACSSPENMKHQDRRKLVMRFFLDTANLEEIREAVQRGLLDGVTTNPSLK